MKILHVSSEYPPAPVYGLGRYVHELAEAQAAAGHHVEVLTNSLGQPDLETVRNRVHIKRVHTPSPPKAPITSSMLLHFQAQLIERMAEQAIAGKTRQYDVINVHDWLTVTAGFHIARLLKCPLVTTIHDVIFNKARHREFTADDEYVAGIENWACQFSNRVIALSESVRNEVLADYHADPRKVVIVPGGVGIRRLDETDLEQVAAWREQITSPEEDLLLYVGRLHGEKGIPTLLDAVRELSQKRATKWKLGIAGDGPLQELIAGYSAKHTLQDRIVSLGYLPMEKLRLAYAAADLLIVPSDYEPFGLVSLEAQRMGTPVVVSDVGGLAEVIETTQGGLTFNVGNSADLCEKLESLLKTPELRAELSARAQSNVERSYAWERIQQQVCRVYESVRSQRIEYSALPQQWSRPNKTAPEPLRNVVVFWLKSDMPRLGPLLNRLANSHVFDSLQGNILVVPLSAGGGDEKWNVPYEHSRVTYIECHNSESLWPDTAAVIAAADIAKDLKNNGILDSSRIPTVWFGSAPSELDGVAATTPEDAYAWAVKLLCDERMRRRAASNLSYTIPQLPKSASANAPTKILHIVPQIVTGGAETVLLDLVKQTHEHFKHVILNLGPSEGPLPDELKRAGAELVHRPKLTTNLSLDAISKLQSDILHLHSMSYVPQWIAAHRRLAEFKIIESEHVVNIGAGHFGPVDTVACVSDAVRKAHGKYTKILSKAGCALKVVYNGIDLGLYDSLPTKAAARARLGLPLNRPIIGRVSALARNKLPMEALQVVPAVLKRLPTALFVIVGDGEQRENAEAWVRKQGLQDAVRFLGERRDIPQILPAFDLFAYYTTKDALGNVILEAVAAGVPVVTTDIEGTSEALGDAPGALVPIGQLEEFADAVCRELDRKPSKRKSAKYKLPAKFGRKEMGSAYGAIYESLRAASEPSTQATNAVSADDQLPPSRILIKFPTRSRPEKFFRTLERYRSFLSKKHSCQFVISCDEDDESMNNEAVRERLRQFSDVVLCYGKSKNKVEAINADIEGREFDVLLLASDDMLPQVKGFDDVIARAMAKNFPDGDGVLFYDDGFRGRALNTFPIVGRAYYERFKYIYHPAYQSLWCDNEFTDVSKSLKRYAYSNDVLFRHAHPANTGELPDALYSRNDISLNSDQETYIKRKAAGFGLNVPDKILLVLLGRLGDVLCCIPTAMQLRQMNPTSRFGWMVLPKYASLVRPHCDQVLQFGNDQDLHRPVLPEIAGEWDRVIVAQPSWFAEEWARRKLPLIDFIAQKAGVSLTARSIQIPLSEQARKRAAELTDGKGKFVVVNSGPHYSGPQWPILQRQAFVANLVKREIPVVAIAGGDGVPLEGATLFNDLDFETSVAVVERAALYVGQDCGTSWLACAAHDTPKIVLIDRDERRSGYDSYVNSVDDKNITEIPLSSTPAEVAQEAMRQLDKEMGAEPRVEVSIPVEKTPSARVPESAKDQTSVDQESQFAKVVHALFQELKPKRIIETGTYHGLGTTAIITRSIRDHNITDSQFYSIECNSRNLKIAETNLQKANLLQYVKLVPGLSIPRELLPAPSEIEAFCTQQEAYYSHSLYVDHDAAKRATLYAQETADPNVPDGQLERCLREFDYRPDFVLLDSAGHIGNIEFQFLISRLKAPCHIAIDDVFHIKHRKSLDQIKADSRFEVLSLSEEKFGFCIARFAPQTTDEGAPSVPADPAPPVELPANVSSESSPSVSVIVITNAGLQGNEKRHVYLKRLLQSIPLSGLPRSSTKVIIAGAIPPGVEADHLVSLPEAAATRQVCRLRNEALKFATGDIVIHCDDDILFTVGYWNSVLPVIREDNWDILCTRLLNPNGSRYWDWAAYIPDKGQTLLSYETQHKFVYATGGHGIYRRKIFEKVRWDEQILHGENEEFRFAADARKADLRFKVCQDATVFLQYHHCDAQAVLEQRGQLDTENVSSLLRSALESIASKTESRPAATSAPAINRFRHKLPKTDKAAANSQIDVSILTCCYRYLERFRVFAQSICRQEYDPARIELVVANPHSPDGLSAYLKTLQTAYKRLSIREVLVDQAHYRNRGLLIQEAFKASKGRFVIGMDCDLVLPPYFLRRILETLHANSKSVVGVYRNFLTAETTASILATAIDPFSTFETLLKENQEEENGYRGVLGYCQATVRQHWNAVGYPVEFDEIAKSDVAFIERLATLGVTPLFMKDLRVLHLNHTRDWTGTKEYL